MAIARTASGALLLAALALSVWALPARGEAALYEPAACLENKDLFEQITCLVELAVRENDDTICDAAIHTGVRYQCYAMVAEKLGNLDICGKIPSGVGGETGQLHDLCVSEVAVNLKDYELCQRIKAPGLRDGCYLEIYRQTDDMSLCEMIQDAGMKSLCTGKPSSVK
jgi:hypothetical protein